MNMIYLIIGACVVLAVLLMVVLLVVWQKDKNQKKDNNEEETPEKAKNTQVRLQGIVSMSKFLDFDGIVDNMIVRKNRTQYVMVIQCKGTNYDLLGEEEKAAIEQGFMQFLNTLRFPIQLYVQTRSINLRESISKYEQRIQNVRSEILKIEAQMKREQDRGNKAAVRKLEFERKRKMNILEYGMDVTNYVSRMSQNRNVLQQNTYVVISYYTAEFGGEISKFSKEEIDEIAFSELYTRAQSAIRGLASAGVTGKVISSEDLAELLYVAYNRDDSELMSIKRAVDAEYDRLYSTAKDVFEKQKQAIEEKIDKEAIDLTAASITKADEILKLQQQQKELIRQRAMEYVEQYKGEMTNELYEETKKQIDKADEEQRKREELQKRRIVEQRRKASAESATEKVPATGKAPARKRTKEEIELLRARRAARLARAKKLAEAEGANQ